MNNYYYKQITVVSLSALMENRSHFTDARQAATATKLMYNYSLTGMYE